VGSEETVELQLSFSFLLAIAGLDVAADWEGWGQTSVYANWSDNRKSTNSVEKQITIANWDHRQEFFFDEKLLSSYFQVEVLSLRSINHSARGTRESSPEELRRANN